MQDVIEATRRLQAPLPYRVSRVPAFLLSLVLLAGLAAELARWERADVPRLAFGERHAAGQPTAPLRLVQRSASTIGMPLGARSAHASALVVLPTGDILAFKFAGARESAPDVQIYSSRWAGGKWSPPVAVASRESIGKALGFGIRRIGNPAAWVAPDGKVHLFVVGTGLGGWAASRVIHLVSSDAGGSYEVRRVLPLSPLFNTSVMVRTSPVGLEDGGWWLPAYFELGNRYSKIVNFDAEGEPRSVARIGRRNSVLQPAVAAVSRDEVRAWMRDASGERRLQQAVSYDGGAIWSDLPALDLINQNTSVAALRLRQGGFVMLHNVGRHGGGTRHVLRLSVSDDARNWSPAFDVAAGEPHQEFSYPSVQQVGDELHVTYTDDRLAIAHHVYEIRYEGRAR